MDANRLTREADTLREDGVTPLERTSSRAMARMRFDLTWASEKSRHSECLVATKLNLWRDLFPPELEPQVMDRPVGHRASHSFAPGN